MTEVCSALVIESILKFHLSLFCELFRGEHCFRFDVEYGLIRLRHDVCLVFWFFFL